MATPAAAEWWAALTALKARLERPELCPCLEDGANREVAVASARELLNESLQHAAAVLDALPYAQRREVALALEQVVAGVMGALWATGEEALAAELVARTHEVIPLHAQSDELAAAAAEPALFVQLVKARWLQRRNLGKRAVAAAEQAASARHPALRQAAEALLGHGETVARAPRLFEVLGCGTVLYGSDARALSGRYFKTHYVALWFVPVFPLARYQVSDIPDGWRFHARVPFSTGQRVWRGLVLLLAVAPVVVYLRQRLG